MPARTRRHDHNRAIHCVERIVSARDIGSTGGITSDYYIRHTHVAEVDSSLRVEAERGRGYRGKMYAGIEHVDDDRLSRSLLLDRRERIRNRVPLDDRSEV